MSLLNEALRKKDRELGQIKKINLFRDKPKPRNRGMRRFSVLVIFMVLSGGLAFLGVWYGFLSADPPSAELQLVNTHVFTEEKALISRQAPQSHCKSRSRRNQKHRP